MTVAQMLQVQSGKHRRSFKQKVANRLLIEAIVCDGLSFNLSSRLHFRRFWSYLCPELDQRCTSSISLVSLVVQWVTATASTQEIAAGSVVDLEININFGSLVRGARGRGYRLLFVWPSKSTSSGYRFVPTRTDRQISICQIYLGKSNICEAFDEWSNRMVHQIFGESNGASGI
ncbi:hypothetical protein BJ742DRAFT_737471 [Cladochytrium replicatum]|nr:hypothetical protein BJ742DRAFT_737471 [Cladochytrium replicatum]